MADPARLSLDTVTLKQWTLAQCIEGLRPARHPRHSALARYLSRDGRGQGGAAHPRRRAARVRPVCHGGIFTAPGALKDNSRAISESHMLEADCLVMVCGGLALDAYHTWWDPDLAAGITQAAPRIASVYVCDWRMPMWDLVLDRPMMGDSGIKICAIRAMVDAAGYAGLIEVQIMSAQDWWLRDGDKVLHVVRERFAQC